MKNITKEEINIKEFFEKYPNVAIALSGGVDSVFLVYMAKKYAKSVKAYFVKSVFQVILDGTNASDDADDRPGMKALQEMKVLSPLRMCGYVKSEIRKQSKEAGLFVYNKPSYACLATRIPTGTEIDEEKIKQVETAETFLFDLGFSDFRVRWMDNKAKIQMPESQLQALMEKREVVLEELSKIFDEVLLDLRTR